MELEERREAEVTAAAVVQGPHDEEEVDSHPMFSGKPGRERRQRRRLGTDKARQRRGGRRSDW